MFTRIYTRIVGVIKQHGLVKAHIPQDQSIGLWDCYFHVDMKGREKVLREKRRMFMLLLRVIFKMQRM
jgi:hypothetical protein